MSLSENPGLAGKCFAIATRGGEARPNPVKGTLSLDQTANLTG